MQMDEYTDISDSTDLIGIIRYESDGKRLYSSSHCQRTVRMRQFLTV
jgi:hypothetical protein